MPVKHRRRHRERRDRYVSGNIREAEDHVCQICHTKEALSELG